MRTSKAQNVWIEKRLLARQAAKRYMRLFKRDCLNDLIQIGLLRRPREYSLETHFMPQLYNQVIQDVTKTETKAEELTDLVSQGAKSSSRAHKESILKEFKRKEEQEKLRLR